MNSNPFLQAISMFCYLMIHPKERISLAKCGDDQNNAKKDRHLHPFDFNVG